MALAERTWERVGEHKRDRARLIESAEVLLLLSSKQSNYFSFGFTRMKNTNRYTGIVAGY